MPVPITLVITDLDVGGAERALVSLATSLDRDRWSPSVICLDQGGALIEPLHQANIETICLNVNRRKPLHAIFKLASTLRQLRPQLVQSFLFHANLATRLAAPLAGNPWSLGGIRVAERQRHWHLKLDRLTQLFINGQVCVSQGVMQFSHDHAKLSQSRLTVIPNGIDPLPFDQATPLDRTTLGIPADSQLALYIGRLDPQKGLPNLLQAAHKVANDIPSLHLALAGDGPDREALQNQADTLPNLAGRVHWLGHRRDVAALLKTADLFVLPSLWEGMPNVVLEAMAARKPVIATAVEGSSDLVVPGETGWLVPAGNSDALALSLREAFTQPECLTRFGEAGRQRVQSHFSRASVTNAYERLWARTLGFNDLNIKLAESD
jgi:starch synthase (maltosyl-transferring)